MPLNPSFKYILPPGLEMKKIILLSILISILIIFLAGCTKANTDFSEKALQQSVDTQEGPKPVAAGLQKGQMPPGFEITTIDNELIKLSSFAENKKPVLLYFFASWCPYCAQDFSVLKTLYDGYAADVPIVAIDLDLGEDALLIAKYKTKYPGLEKVMFAAGKESILEDYNIIHTTTKYAIGRDGTVLYSGSGTFNEEQWKILLNALKNS